DAARRSRRPGARARRHVGSRRPHPSGALLGSRRRPPSLGHRRRVAGYARVGSRRSSARRRGPGAGVRAEPDAGCAGELLARGPGRDRDVDGLRHRGLPGLRGAANVRLLRQGMHGWPRLPRRLDPLERPACPPALPGDGLSGPREVGGVRLKTPVMAASGTFGYGTEVPLCDRRLLGGMVSKGIFLEPRLGTPPPRIVETPSGMLNAIGLQGPGVEALVCDYAPQWATWDFPVLVNINGETVGEYGELAARLDGVPGVAGLEINISCPNVREGGMFFGNEPAAPAAATAAAP